MALLMNRLFARADTVQGDPETLASLPALSAAEAGQAAAPSSVAMDEGRSRSPVPALSSPPATPGDGGHAESSRGRGGGGNTRGQNARRRKDIDSSTLFGPPVVGTGVGNRKGFRGTTGASASLWGRYLDFAGSRNAVVRNEGLGVAAGDDGRGEEDKAETNAPLEKQMTEREKEELANGVDVETIRRWVERSGQHPAALSTTLQSLVNLKRNTVRLAPLPSTTPSSSPAPLDSSVLSPTHSFVFTLDSAAPRTRIRLIARHSATTCRAKVGAGARGWHELGEIISESAISKRCFGRETSVKVQLPPPVKGKKKVESSDPILTVDGGNGGTNVERDGAELDAEPEPEDEREFTSPVPAPGLEDEVVPLGDISSPYDNASPSTTPAPARNGETAAGATAETSLKGKEKEKDAPVPETCKLGILVEALDADGEPLPSDMANSQTTFLRVTGTPVASALSDDTPVSALEEPQRRTWLMQVEGQEAQIGPHRFQLQELYALSSRPPVVIPSGQPSAVGEDDEREHEPAEGEDDVDGNGHHDEADPSFLGGVGGTGSGGTECLICLSSPPTTVLLPCTHGLCLECAVQLRESVKRIRETERRRGRAPRKKYVCPVCRRPYQSMLHIARATEKEEARDVLLRRDVFQSSATVHAAQAAE